MITEHEAKQKVLNLLRAHLGTGETPAGSNHNFITDWYNRNVAKIGNGPWCQMTDTWSVWACGFQALMKAQAYTVYAAQDAINGIDGMTWHYGTKGMKAGDHVYYDWTRGKGSSAISKIDHTGTVEKILPGGFFYALEGNMGDKLVRVKRDATYVVGYLRLDWSKVGHKVAKKPAPAPTHTEPAKPIHTPSQAPEVVNAIKDIQRAAGLAGKDVDGLWGKKTDAAVEEFRKKHRIHS